MKKLIQTMALTMAIATAPVAAQEADDPVIAALKLDKQRAEAEKAAADADKARSDAEAAAAAAKFGPLSSYQTAGTTEVGANSGKLEATLLASLATKSAAGDIVDDLCTILAPERARSACVKRTKCAVSSDPALFVFPDSAMPNFDVYDAFTAQLNSIHDQLRLVKDLKPVKTGPSPGVIQQGTDGGIGVALSVLGNLFRSDYKISSIDISQTDMLLLRSFVEQARDKCLNRRIQVPTMQSGRIDFPNNPAIQRIGEVKMTRDEVAALARQLRIDLAARPKEKDSIEPVMASMDQAVARYDAFMLKLGTADDKGVVPLATVARQAMLDSMITDDTVMVFLKGEMAGGSAYAKKNFWTFFGDMPFSVSGGSLVSYTLVRGRKGDVLDAGTLARTEPFMKIHAATRHFLAKPAASAK